MNIPSSRRGGISYGFSTMGCPDISLPELLILAREFEMDFVELRALDSCLDLPVYFDREPVAPDFSPQPPVRLVATNLQLTRATPADIDVFLRYVDVAIRLGAPYVRVFGGGAWKDPLSPAQWAHAAHTVRECRRRISEKTDACEMLLETHSSFSSSAMCVKLNQILDEPMRLLWDSHHTWRLGGETPAEFWRELGPVVRHIHFSDSRLKCSSNIDYECTLPGMGEFPVAALRDLLARINYRHGVSLEWEKIWHPELPDIQLALGEFQNLFIRPVSVEKAAESIAHSTP